MTKTKTTGRINVPLLISTLAYIEEHPETWDQAYWRHVPYTTGNKPKVDTKQRCGANLCFAGHVAAVTGGKWLLEADDLQKMIENGDDPNEWDYALSALKPITGEETTEIHHPVTGRTRKTVSARTRAMNKLGLNEVEANELFNGNNSIWKLRLAVSRLIKTAYTEETISG